MLSNYDVTHLSGAPSTVTNSFVFRVISSIPTYASGHLLFDSVGMVFYREIPLNGMDPGRMKFLMAKIHLHSIFALSKQDLAVDIDGKLPTTSHAK